jgi:proteasome assembly chaperone (PAC2) family protein
MTNSRKEGERVERGQVEIYRSPQLESPSLIVSWQTQDVGKLASRVIDFLIEKLGGQPIAEITPLGFFPLGGVRFKDDLVQAPGCTFWACEKRNLLLFKSDEPAFDHDRFLNVALDFAKDHCRVKDVYTLNGAVSYVAHTHPREILSVFNCVDLKERLREYGLREMTWEGPPAMSSYLLWVAQRRGVPGVSLWPEIPFYLAAGEDPEAIKETLSFLNRRFDLDLNLAAFDAEIIFQHERIARLRKESVEIDRSIRRVEHGDRLDDEGQSKLTKEIYELFESRERL